MIRQKKKTRRVFSVLDLSGRKIKAKLGTICMSHQNVNLRVDKISPHAQLLRDKIAKMKRLHCPGLSLLYFHICRIWNFIFRDFFLFTRAANFIFELLSCCQIEHMRGSRAKNETDLKRF